MVHKTVICFHCQQMWLFVQSLTVIPTPFILPEQNIFKNVIFWDKSSQMNWNSNRKPLWFHHLIKKVKQSINTQMPLILETWILIVVSLILDQSVTKLHSHIIIFSFQARTRKCFPVYQMKSENRWDTAPSVRLFLGTTFSLWFKCSWVVMAGGQSMWLWFG